MDGVKRVTTIYGEFFSWQDDLVTEHLKNFSAHTRNEIAILGSVIKEGDTILDIGAHIGTYSIPLARFSNGKVYSFEASPANYELLLKNIEVNGLTEIITPIHAVVSEEDNQGFRATLPEGGNSGMYYFTPSDNYDVKSINIDSWHTGEPIHVIKIDVEGMELCVLKSCVNIIEKYKPVLYVEINKTALERFGKDNEDIESILKPLGYRFFRNIGKRNSASDDFKIAKMSKIEHGGEFFDLLAIHTSDERYPKNYSSGARLKMGLVYWKCRRFILSFLRKALQPLKRFSIRD